MPRGGRRESQGSRLHTVGFLGPAGLKRGIAPWAHTPCGGSLPPCPESGPLLRDAELSPHLKEPLATRREAGWGAGPVETQVWTSNPTFTIKPAVVPQEQRQQLGNRNVPDLQQQKEAARRKVREEKARQARRLAVQVPGVP